MIVKSDQLHCDFCYTVLTESSPHKDYSCKDFDLPWPGHTSLGTWLACSECAVLVDAELYYDLVDRVMSTDFESTLATLDLTEQEVIALLLRETYRRFKSNRLDK